MDGENFYHNGQWFLTVLKSRSQIRFSWGSLLHHFSITLVSVGISWVSVGDHLGNSWYQLGISWVSVGYQFVFSYVQSSINSEFSQVSVGCQAVYHQNSACTSGYSCAPVWFQPCNSYSLGAGLQTRYSLNTVGTVKVTAFDSLVCAGAHACQHISRGA